MRHLDLFSGIGGFALGLKRAGGFETIGFCDNDKKTHLVLKKNFPGVPIYDDVKTLKGEQVGSVDIITGGFPCQDISTAGKGAGLAGERSGLWFEMHRIIKETRPKWVIAENVSALRSRGLEQVLWSLTEIGYDAEWHCIPASAVGAPHRRDRIWIVAYPRHSRWWNCISGSVGENGDGGYDTEIRTSETVAATRSSQTSCTMAYPDRSKQSNGRQCQDIEEQSSEWRINEERSSSDDWKRCIRGSRCFEKNRIISSVQQSTYWKVEPGVDRVADGLPGRMDRLKQLGNAIVPQIAELLGLAIKKETH